ncbi:MAG: hypothetical protein M1832_004122 [Thelocarpon impressellum]|nr:MAG: hypothetical protein M1832_004122 [Thelocarpon impressellum]
MAGPRQLRRVQRGPWRVIGGHWLTPPLQASSSFSTTALLSKKKAPKASRAEAPPSPATGTDEPATDDPFDLTALTAAIAAARARLADDLAALRASRSGRFDPTLLEALRVQLRKGSGEKDSVVRLGDVAQVLPRGGRMVSIVVGEKDHLKPVSSTILSSPHSLAPQPSPTSPLELLVPLPPPTAEARAAALAAAGRAGEAATERVRRARQAQQKRLRRMELDRAVRPDDLRKAQQGMERAFGEGVKALGNEVAGWKRGVEG